MKLWSLSQQERVWYNSMKGNFKLGNTMALAVDTNDADPIVIISPNNNKVWTLFDDEESLNLIAYILEHGETMRKDIEQAMRDRKHGLEDNNSTLNAEQAINAFLKHGKDYYNGRN